MLFNPVSIYKLITNVLSECLPINEFSTLSIFLKASMKISIASIPKFGSFTKLSSDELFEYFEAGPKCSKNVYK